MKFSAITLLSFVLLFHSRTSDAQFYSTGESPASVRWSQIITPRFRVVFPNGLQSDARRFIRQLEKSYSLTAQDYPHRPLCFPVLMQSASVMSNGYVTWAPKRMELVTTPPQDSYAQDWISQLALHEYRHVVQVSQLFQGFTRAFSVITGEIAPGVSSALIPPWFFEGDAVLNETVRSAAGRGRNPRFEMPLRALLLNEKRVFSYDKAFFGSYRDFTPDHYQYGYEMVSFANARYGPDLWPGALSFTARNPYFIWPLAFYLRKNTGLYKQGLYHKAMDSLRYLYNKQEKEIMVVHYSSKNQRRSPVYTNYKLPQDLGDGSVIALKTGINLRDQFVVIDSTGHERRMLIPGITSGLKLDVHGNYLVWDEFTGDPRWGRRDYSEIRLFDMKEKKKYNLTKRSRYFSPDFSPDGKTIAVAETDLLDRNFLTLLDAVSGQAVLRIPAPENKALQFPGWISGTRIMVITVSGEGKQIEEVNTESKMWHVLIHNTRFDISEPLYFRGYILFRSSYSGIENIFALGQDQRLFQLTFSASGAFNPSVTADSTALLFSEYSKHGFNITRVTLEPASWLPVISPAGPSGMWPDTYAGKDHMAGHAEVADSSWKIKPYARISHLFRFHSWLPIYASVSDFTGRIDGIPVQPGVMLFSQNLLSTFISSIDYHYTKGYHYFSPRLSWRGWYPVIELSADIGGPARALRLPEGISLPDKTGSYIEFHINTYVPLIFNRGKYISYLEPRLEYQRSSDYYYAVEGLRQGLDYVHYRLFISHLLRRSLRDLYPRWGQYISLTYTDTPADLGQLGTLFSVEGGIYLPGMAAHHHLLLKGGFQEQYAQRYFLPINRIDFPRGYPSAVSKGFEAFSADYAFPVAYPDLSLGPVLYLKRIRADVFHDRSYGIHMLEAGQSRDGSLVSSGVEILADFHFARIIFPVSAGVRLAYKHKEAEFLPEFLFSIQTNTF